MGYRVAVDERRGLVRVTQGGLDCDALDAMSAMQAVRADPRFRSMDRILVDLREGEASRTMLEAEVLAGMLGTLFRGKRLAYVVPDDLRLQVDYAASLVNDSDGTTTMGVFPGLEAAERWLDHD